MIPSNLSALPSSFAAGETVTYLRTVPAGYGPGDGWALTTFLAGVKTLQATGVSEAGAFRVTFPAAETAPLEAGSYRWVERLSKAAISYDFASGFLVVTPNVGTAGQGDLQAWAEKTLPIVEAAIAGRLPSGMDSYQIAGRAVSKIPIRDLFALRAQLQSEVNRIRNPGSLGRTIKVSFPPA